MASVTNANGIRREGGAGVHVPFVGLVIIYWNQFAGIPFSKVGAKSSYSRQGRFCYISLSTEIDQFLVTASHKLDLVTRDVRSILPIAD